MSSIGRFSRCLLTAAGLLILSTQASAQLIQDVSGDPDPVAGVFGRVTYIVTLNNSGGPRPGYTFDIQFGGQGGGFGFLSPDPQTTPEGWLCEDPQLSGTYTCTPPGSVPTGISTVTITADVNASKSIIFPDTVDFIATDGSTSASFTTTISGPIAAQLAFTGSAVPAAVVPGDPLDFVFSVENTAGGPTNGFSIDLQNEQPAGIVQVPSQPDWNCFQSVSINCQFVGTLNVGETADLRVPATAPDQSTLGPFSVDGMLTPQPPDTVVTTDMLSLSSTNATIVTEGVLSTPNDPTGPGEPLVYVADVTNEPGMAPATNVSLFFDLSDDQQTGTAIYDSGTGSNWICTPFGQQLKGKRGRQSPGLKGLTVGVACAYQLTLAPGATTPPVTVTIFAPTSPTVSAVSMTIGPSADNNTSFPSPSAIITGIAPINDFSITKSASSGSVLVGDSFTYTLDISAAGPTGIDAGNFTVTDTLPAEVSFDGVTSSTPDISCTEATGTVTCSYIGSPQASPYNASVDIDVTAVALGTVTNTADVVVNSPLVDPNNGDNSDSAVVTIVAPGADLSLAKSASNNAPTQGDVLDYTLDVSNAGPATASSFTVTDTLPSQVTYQGFSAVDFNCTDSAGTVTCTYTGTGGLAAGQTTSITLNVSADTPGVANNTATVSADAVAPDGNNGNNTDSASITIAAPPMANITTVVTDSVDPVEPGGLFDLTVSLSNSGPADANNLFADIFLDEGVTYVPQVVKGGGGWSCFLSSANKAPKGSVSGAFVSCSNPGPLLVGQATSVTITLQAPNAPGLIATDVFVVADEFGPSLTTETTGVGTDVDLRITKDADALQVARGADFEYSISVFSVSGSATNITVSDTLPAGVTLRNVNTIDWSCQLVQNTVSCSYLPGALGPGEQTSALRLAVTAPDADVVITNTASVSSDQNDVNRNNNSDSVDVQVGGSDRVNLELQKSSLAETVVAGQPFQYLLRVINNGMQAASSVQIVDELPPGMDFVAGSGVGWNCSAAGNLVTCDLGGQILPDLMSDLLLDVTAPDTPGLIRNTAQVSSAELDTDTVDNTSAADTNVLPAVQADIGLTKQVDRESARFNDVLTYAIDVVNNGPAAASQVRVEDALPSGITLADVNAPGWNCQVTQAAVSCELMDDLGVGEMRGITLTGRVNVSSGSIENEAVVTAATQDLEPGNNSDQATTSVIGPQQAADLEITLNDSVDPVLTGDPFDYQLVLRNNGPAMASDYDVRGMLPPGLTVDSVSSGEKLDCEIEAAQLICRSVGNLEVNLDQQITLSVRAPDESSELSFSVETRFVGLGLDDNPSNNTDTETTTVRLTPTVDQLEDSLEFALGDTTDPVVRDNLAPTAALCGNPPPDVVPLCRAIADALNDGRSSEVANAIRQIVGRQTQTQHTSLVESNGVQFQNVQQRFSQNRNGGGSGFSMNGLNFRFGNESIAMAYLQAADSEDPEIDSAGLVKPWGFFINGTVSGGDKDSSAREIGYDFDTLGITAGVDYRFSTRFIGGAAIGFADYESEMTDGGELKSDGITAHVFASYYPTDRLYLDALLSFGSMDFEQVRPISFTIGDLVVDEIARGDADSDQLSGSLALGYNLNRNGWNFTPSASLSYMDADIDSFTEAGTFLALEYQEQQVESLVFSANLSVSKVISLARGVLTPTFDLAYHHEAQNDDNGFNSRIIGASAASSFLVDADDPDRNYGSAGLGLVFVGANGRQAFLSYRNILGLSGFSRWTVNAGVRFEF